MTEQYHMDQQRIRELEEQVRHSIRKEESVRLQQVNEKLKTELTETKAALNTYKNMTEVIAD